MERDPHRLESCFPNNNNNHNNNHNNHEDHSMTCRPSAAGKKGRHTFFARRKNEGIRTRTQHTKQSEAEEERRRRRIYGGRLSLSLSLSRIFLRN